MRHVVHVRRGILLPLALAAALLGSGAAPAPTPRDERDIMEALKRYFTDKRPSVSISINRGGTVEPTENSRCVMSGYKDNFIAEHPLVGYAPWVAWAVKSGLVEYRTISTPRGLAVRCPFAIEQQLVTNYRVSWDNKPGLLVWLASDVKPTVTGFKQSAATMDGVPNVPTYDLALAIGGTPQWPGVIITPSTTPSTIRILRSPKTGTMEVVEAKLNWPTVSLAE